MVEERAVVREIVLQMLQDGMRTQPLELTVDMFVQRAEAIRDALAPFDSGVRVTEIPVSHHPV